MGSSHKIIFSHHAPKGSDFGIKVFVLAENEEQIYEWIASEPDTKEGRIYNSWRDREICGDDYDDCDDKEGFKDKMIRIGGEINDDCVDFSDAYYGVTLYGWELVKEGVSGDYSELIELEEIINLAK